MKHIALRSRSNRKIGSFTTPGLGDRLQACLIGYNYYKKNNTPVQLHLTADKFGKTSKKESWAEILTLLPEGSVTIKDHPVKDLPEKDWIKYLKQNNIDAETYYYSDFPGRYEIPEGCEEIFDAVEYLKTYPEIKVPEVDIDLPKKFVTAQFDSNGVPSWKDIPGDFRKIPSLKVQELFNQCKSVGYEVIIVGGESKDNRLNGPGCLKNIAYVMSKAKYHMGADSGFFHLANMVLPRNKIRLYIRGGTSHHTLRARSNGVKVIDIR